jgi:hypothetical protein
MFLASSTSSTMQVNVDEPGQYAPKRVKARLVEVEVSHNDWMRITRNGIQANMGLFQIIKQAIVCKSAGGKNRR